jgi:Putative Ig domain
MRFLRFLALALILAGCSTQATTPGEALDIKVDALPPAYIGEAYTATIRAVGGLTPYQYKLDKGTLPPGLSLQGGEIRGTPSEKGDFTFTITASDGNLSKTFEEYNLSVTEAPPAQLTLNVPNTQIQRPVTLRGDIKEARGLQGFRTLITWDTARFALVPGSVRPNNDAFLLFFDEAPGQLRVDVGLKSGVLTGGRRIFEFTLQPLQRTNADGTPAPASTLQLESKTEFLGENNQHAYTTLSEGVAATDEPQSPDGTNDTGNPDDTTDTDGNGIPDSQEDADGDGIPNSQEDLNGNGTDDDQETSNGGNQ